MTYRRSLFSLPRLGLCPLASEQRGAVRTFPQYHSIAVNRLTPPWECHQFKRYHWDLTLIIRVMAGQGLIYRCSPDSAGSPAGSTAQETY